MTQLKHDVSALHRLLDPTLDGSAVFLPDDSDQNASFKRELLAKANHILDAAEAAIAGKVVETPRFGESDWLEVALALETDPLRPEFVELAGACRSVVRSMAMAAA